MSLLTTVQRFCRRTNQPVPNSVYGTSDNLIAQVMALLEEEGNELSGRGHWSSLVQEATHTTLAQENQGAMTDIADDGFRYIINDTIWNRDLKLPVYGPLSDEDWQAVKAMVVTGPRNQYRIRGGDLLTNPTPTAGQTWAFEYMSWNWISNAAGDTTYQYFTADTNLILLPEEIVLTGLRWRWMREMGLDYGELFRSYEMMVKDALGRDGGKKTLNQGCSPYEPKPTVFIPAGNWISP